MGLSGFLLAFMVGLAQNKEKSWHLLEHLRSFVNGAWLCAGDFNAILNSAEKLSLRPPNSVEIDAFRNVLDSCTLEDLGYRGYTYTWSNKRPGVANTKLRLDRAVATMEWRGKISDNYSFSSSTPCIGSFANFGACEECSKVSEKI